MEDEGSLSDTYINVSKSQYTKYHDNDSGDITINVNNKEIFDPKIKEKICCIELVNNNKIYIKYELEWTIRDVKLNLKSAFTINFKT
jgi:hypothetical protein